jgi:cyanate lyase
MTTKQEAAAQAREAKARLGLTWAQLAEAVGRPVAWTTSALLGQQPMSAGRRSRR